MVSTLSGDASAVVTGRSGLADVAARATAFQRAFPHWPASWPSVVQEQDRDVLYATWLIGNDYRNAASYYGSYPPRYLDRVFALFPDVDRTAWPPVILHAFSGSLPNDSGALRLDLRQTAELSGNVYDARKLLDEWAQSHALAGVGFVKFQLVLADPPYRRDDAQHYGTPMVCKRRAIAALAEVTHPGGFLCWLDTTWPQHDKRHWLTVGRITVVRSTNHRIRMLTIFQRTTA